MFRTLKLELLEERRLLSVLPGSPQECALGFAQGHT